MSFNDPLHLVPVEKWNDVKNVLKTDLPRCIAVFNTLEVQRRWLENGFDYEFKIYCPLGDYWKGVVALHKKIVFYEIFLDCPTNDTTVLEDALRRTKLIEWTNTVVMFTAEHVTKCIENISKDINANLHVNKLNLYILNEEMPLFDISLPADVTFEPLKLENVDIIDAVWPHRYEGSTKYFEVLIKNKYGYGLYKNDQLLAWAFIKEMGALGHIYTVDNYRLKGYGMMVVKLLCNTIRKENLHVFSYAIKSNVSACKMHEKIGFKKNSEVGTCHFIVNK